MSSGRIEREENYGNDVKGEIWSYFFAPRPSTKVTVTPS